MRLWLNDWTYGARRLIERPGFTTAALTLIGLGIALNAVLFSALDAFVLRALPVADPARLVEIIGGPPQRLQPSLSFEEFANLRSEASALEGVTLYQTRGAILKLNNLTEAVPAAVVSENHFAVLRMTPKLGSYEGLNPAIEPVAVISDSLWRRRFSGKSAVIGSQVLFNSIAVRIVAVADPDYHGLEVVPVDVWFPLETWVIVSGDSLSEIENGQNYHFRVWGLLAVGRTLSEAQGQLDVVAARMAAAHPEIQPARILKARLEADEVKRNYGLAFALFGPLALTIILVPCANVLGLLLIQAHGRRREVAIRIALGAGKWRIFRQLLSESLLLSGLACGLGLAVASGIITIVPSLIPPLPLTVTFDMRLDHRVILFSSLMALLSVLLCALLPMRQSLTNIQSALVGLTANQPRHRWRLNSMVAVAQITASFVLLSVAGLLVRSYSNTLNLDPGFKPSPDVYVVLTVARPGNKSDATAYSRDVRSHVLSLPGVAAVSLASTIPLPMEGGGKPRQIWTPGLAKIDGPLPVARVGAVDREYFDIMGVRILRGRSFLNDQREVVINTTMARQYWGQNDPVGEMVRIDGAQGETYRVAGVTADGKYGSIHEQQQPYLYVPFDRFPSGESYLVIRTASAPTELPQAIRDAVVSASPEAALLSFMTLEKHYFRGLYIDRFISRALLVAAAVATGLATIGLYSTLAFSVRLRRKDIAIRLAVGACRRDITGLVLNEGVWLIFGGLAIGLTGSLLVARLFQGLLYGVQPHDPLTLILAIVTLAVLSLFACFIPARRAAGIAPGSLLREL